MGNKNFGIDPERLQDYATDIKQIVDLGVQVAIVIGGGNIFRGFSNNNEHKIDRVQGDPVSYTHLTLPTILLV